MLGYPPGTRDRHPPGPEAGTPPGADPPQEQCMLGDTGNKRTVRILLECNLVCQKLGEWFALQLSICELPDSEFCRFRRKYHSNCSVLLFPLLKNVNVAALPTLAFSSCQTVKFTLRVDTSLFFADFDYACMEILTKLYIWIHLTLLAFSMEPPRNRSTNCEHCVKDQMWKSRKSWGFRKTFVGLKCMRDENTVDTVNTFSCSIFKSDQKISKKHLV